MCIVDEEKKIMKSKKLKRAKRESKWTPYVSSFTGGTWGGGYSSCCDNPAHNGYWNGKPGYMCQKCGKACKVKYKYL